MGPVACRFMYMVYRIEHIGRVCYVINLEIIVLDFQNN